MIESKKQSMILTESNIRDALQDNMSFSGHIDSGDLTRELVHNFMDDFDLDGYTENYVADLLSEIGLGEDNIIEHLEDSMRGLIHKAAQQLSTIDPESKNLSQGANQLLKIVWCKIRLKHLESSIKHS